MVASDVTMAAHLTRAVRRALLAGGLPTLRAEMGEAAVAALAAFRCIEEAARFLVLLGALLVNRLLRRPLVRAPIPPPVVATALVARGGNMRLAPAARSGGVTMAARVLHLVIDHLVHLLLRQAAPARRRRVRHHDVRHLDMHELDGLLDRLTQLLSFAHQLHPFPADRQICALRGPERHLHRWRPVDHMLTDMAAIQIELLRRDPGPIRVHLEPDEVLTDQIQVKAAQPSLVIDVLHGGIVERDPYRFALLVAEDLFTLAACVLNERRIAWFGRLGRHLGEVVHLELLSLVVANQPAQCIFIGRLPCSIRLMMDFLGFARREALVLRRDRERYVDILRRHGLVQLAPRVVQMAANEGLLRIQGLGGVIARGPMAQRIDSSLLQPTNVSVFYGTTETQETKTFRNSSLPFTNRKIAHIRTIRDYL